MHLRCERCATVYELDERVLPPGGAPVQCSRCRHVFQARPPEDGGKTWPMFPVVQPPPAPQGPGAPGGRPGVAPVPGPPAAGAPVPVAPRIASAPVAPRMVPVAAGAAPAPAPAAASPPAAFARSEPVPAGPRRGAAPDGSGAASGEGGGDWRTDTVTLMVRRMRSRRLWSWLGPLLLLAAGGAAGGLLWHRSRQVSPEALVRREEGLRLLARDDAGSLERAAEVLAGAARLDRRLFQARADRGLALTLLASDERDRAAELEAGFKALDAERFRLEARAEQGWERRQAEAIDRMKALRARIEPLRERAAALGREAFAELEGVARPHRDDAAVARALALHYLLDGDVERGARVARNARAAGLADPWLDLAEAAEDVVAANSEVARRRAVDRLAPLAAARPDLLRARMLLARAEADLGRADAAVAALDAVLEANAAHERARELKARLLEPPAAEPLRPRVPQQAPPARRPGRLPRKPEGGER